SSSSPTATSEADPPPERGWLTRGVAGVGAASFFSDAGHEITTALLPTLLVSVLKAPAAALGVIEGISDALVGVAKLVGGPLANDDSRRLRLASGGYLATALATGAIGAAVATWQVGALRAFAWISRGIRSPARDTMLAQLAPPHAYGRAFGLERAGDNLGAVVGPLLAAGLIHWIGIRPALYLAAAPGTLAALAITVAAHEARGQGEAIRRRVRLHLADLRTAGVVRPLLPIAAFELGNVATTLLILRATTLLHHGGRTLAAATSLAVIVYAGHNLFGSGVAYAGGHWIDRAGPRSAFAAGAALYVGAYLLFATAGHSWPPLLIAFLLAGAGIGLAETAESSLFARLLPAHLRASGFGLLGGVQAFGDFASSAVVGVLWTVASPSVAFVYAAAWVGAAAVLALARPITE
ncbi:MAG: MFS transporter, partial [Gaiellaceae bacterium]